MITENTIEVFKDGADWCALIGENIQEGIAGFGYTPRAALTNLVHNLRDEEWRPQETRKGK